MARPKNIVASVEVPVEEMGHGKKFESLRRRLGVAAGGEKLGCSLYELPPGKAAFPFHAHLANVGDARPEQRPHALEERWIAWRLDRAQAQVDEHLGAFDFSPATNVLYHVTFDDFCDWYAEAIKQRLYDGDEDAQATALANLERLLKLLHPVLPHVTEEIWSNLPARETCLIVAP